MTEQSAQLQSVEQALQEQGIAYQIQSMKIDGRQMAKNQTQVKSTTVTVTVYGTDDET